MNNAFPIYSVHSLTCLLLHSLGAEVHTRTVTLLIRFIITFPIHPSIHPSIHLSIHPSFHPHHRTCVLPATRILMPSIWCHHLCCTDETSLLLPVAHGAHSSGPKISFLSATSRTTIPHIQQAQQVRKHRLNSSCSSSSSRSSSGSSCCKKSSSSCSCGSGVYIKPRRSSKLS
jgi:hypothetical protein